MDIIDFDKEVEVMLGFMCQYISEEVYNTLAKAVSSNLLRLAAQAQMTPTSDYDYTDKLREVLDVQS